MTTSSVDHPDEQALERFIMERCADTEWGEVVDHLSGCEACQQREVALRELIENVKAGGVLLAAQQAVSKEHRTWRSWFTIPALSMAGAAAAIALAFAGLSIPAEVNLSAHRGAETIKVPDWRPLQLHLDLRDLDAKPAGVEVADTHLAITWQGPLSIVGDQAEVRMPAVRQPGDYAIRLKDAQGNLLREFAVQAQPFP